MRQIPLTLGLLALFASACGGGAISPAMVQRAQAQDPSATEASLTQGKALYEQKCGTCHELYVPSAFSAAKWPGIVEHMGPLAKISKDDERLVLNYVIGASGE